MTIRIACSKMDQLRLGDSVVVARLGTFTCPVVMLEQYLSRTATAAGDQRFSNPVHQNGEILRSSGKISYSCLAELFKKKLKALGFATNLFGLHSLRAGGQQLFPMLGYLISLLRGMGDGTRKCQGWLC